MVQKAWRAPEAPEGERQELREEGWSGRGVEWRRGGVAEGGSEVEVEWRSDGVEKGWSGGWVE